MFKEVIKKIVTNILIAFYQPFLFAVLLSVFLCLCIYMLDIQKNLKQMGGRIESMDNTLKI